MHSQTHIYPHISTRTCNYTQQSPLWPVYKTHPIEDEKEHITDIFHSRQHLYFEKDSPLSLPLLLFPLPFSLLAYSLLLCLTKSLTQLGLPPVSAKEIQGLPEEQSQYQRPAAPSFRRKPPILPPPLSFRPVLFPFWGRGWGSNDGRYPSLSSEL